MQTKCLAIVAGSGDLPIKIVEYCKKYHVDFRIIHFEGVELNWLDDLPVLTAKYEKPNSLFASLKRNGLQSGSICWSYEAPKIKSIKV